MLIKITDNYSYEPESLIASEDEKNTSQLKLYFGDQRNFPDELSYFYSYLSNQEINRSKRFKKKADERTYVITHALVNRKISELLKMNFDKIIINYFDNKKPYVDGSTIDFNISHSSDYFAFALSSKDNFFIGVDIELVKENFDIEPIIKNYFHTNEIEYILNNNLSKLIQHKRFYEVWTRKEAVLKMLGLGITEDLSEIDLSPGSKEITIEDKKNIYNANSPETFISSFVLSTNLVLSLSTNNPVVISLEECKVF